MTHEIKILEDMESKLIEAALKILESRATYSSVLVTSSEVAKNMTTLKISNLDHEVFAVMFMNTDNSLISYEILFTGTVDRSAVYPRNIVKRALELNASAVILTHNHPSGNITPSSDDKKITDTLEHILGIVDVRVIDHIIAGKGGNTYSFREHGLL